MSFYDYGEEDYYDSFICNICDEPITELNISSFYTDDNGDEYCICKDCDKNRKLSCKNHS